MALFCAEVDEDCDGRVTFAELDRALRRRGSAAATAWSARRREARAERDELVQRFKAARIGSTTARCDPSLRLTIFRCGAAESQGAPPVTAREERRTARVTWRHDTSPGVLSHLTISLFVWVALASPFGFLFGSCPPLTYAGSDPASWSRRWFEGQQKWHSGAQCHSRLFSALFSVALSFFLSFFHTLRALCALVCRLFVFLRGASLSENLAELCFALIRNNFARVVIALNRIGLYS